MKNFEEYRHSRLRRWGVRLAWMVAILLFIGILLRMSLKTNVVRQWVKNFVVSTSNQQLNAKLVIEDLSGDLWYEARLSGIRLTQEDTIAQIDSLHASYNVWALLGGRIELSDLGIYRPTAELRQKAGRWNFQQLISESSDTDTTGGAISISIDNLILKDGSISVQSDSLPVESDFGIKNLMLSSSFGYSDDSFDVNLRDLSFEVENTQFEQPLRVQTSASVGKERITLEKLVLATGNSVLQSSGYADPADSAIRVDFSATPVSWKDIVAYARDFPLRKNIRMDLALSGKPEQFELTLNMEGEGVQSLTFSSRFQWRSSIALQQFKTSADYLSLAELFSDTTLPTFRDFDLSFSGNVDISDYQQAQGNLAFSAKEILQPPYDIDRISGKGSINGQIGTLELDANRLRQQVEANVRVEQIWSELPFVKATINADNIDPAFWIQDTSYAGDISFRSEFSGRDWYPSKSPWSYSLNMNDSKFMGQPIADFTAKGQVSESEADVDARLKIREGVVSIMANFRDIMQAPAYDYSIQTRDFDLGALMGEKEFSTVMNSKIQGTGRGFDPASMQLNASVAVDSSLVNNELVRNFSAELSIRDTVAVVKKARLQSTIAEGSFNLRLNMLRRFDSDNELDFDLLLKDLGALAPLAGVKDMQAEGEIEGHLSPLDNEDLRFLGTFDLSDVIYNDLFTAKKAQGSLEVRTQQNLVYLADLNLTTPTFSGVQLQNLELITIGNYSDSKARGRYEFQFSGPAEGRIEQSGSYSMMKDSVIVRTTEFNIISDYRTLTLERPFEMQIRNDTLRMDTMRVSSGSGVFLEMGAPLVSAKEQRGFIRGNLLNTSVIQNSIFGKSYFNGLLSGQFEINRKDTNLDARGELLLSEISYQGTDFDSLRITGKIEDERLAGNLSLQHEGKQLVDGKADLPFKLGNPEEFPSSFFDESVSGNLRIRDIPLQRFDTLFAKTGITQTAGTFSFRGHLEGSAGEPEFIANASLKNALLSGVPVDSVTAGADYSHEGAELELEASVISLRQQAAQISARLPLYINMKSFRVDLPRSQDSIAVDVETHNFNLKALNDFLDRRTLREVTGELNGVVHVNGPMENLKTDGELVLGNGAFRLMPAGIKVDNIESAVNFDPNQIRLTNFSAKSGKGDLKANGKLSLEKLVPQDIDFSVKAQNFRAANTSQYNAVINLDAKAQGSLTQPKVTGNLNFISGFVKLQNFGEKSVETIELDSLEENGPEINIYDSLALDLDVTFDRRFYIRNERYLEMEIELAGELDMLKKSGEDLQLFGTITTPSGYARPFGKEFTLEEGNIAFRGEPENPQLMVRTQYEPPQTQENIVIWYIIEGTVEDPKFKYESQPPMELENIISYTLFGQPFYALDSWKQVVASSGSNTTAANVALDVLLDRVEALATQKLGIDVVKIDNSRVSGEAGTFITTGWYLNPKVFFAIQNVITGSTPDTGFLLEYLLREDLKLIIRQGSGIRQGVDLKWNYDY